MDYDFTVSIQTQDGEELSEDDIEELESLIMDRLQSRDIPNITVQDVELAG